MSFLARPSQIPFSLAASLSNARQTMKILTFFLFFVLFSTNLKATQQIPDLLIVGKDTLHIFEPNNYPLEKLNLKRRPFNYTETTSPHTACWRGYQAIWKIIDNELFLEKIQRCYGDDKPDKIENLDELFKENNINVVKKNNLIFANWVNINLYKYQFYTTQTKKERRNLLTDYWSKKSQPNKSDLKIQIINGIVTKNDL